MVFLTTSLKVARQYAGPNGSIYEVEPEQPVPFVEVYEAGIKGKSRCNVRKKLKKMAKKSRHVFVAKSAKVIADFPACEIQIN